MGVPTVAAGWLMTVASPVLAGSWSDCTCRTGLAFGSLPFGSVFQGRGRGSCTICAF